MCMSSQNPGAPLLLLVLNHFSRVRLCATPSLGFSTKNTGVGCHFLLQRIKVKSEREVTVMSNSSRPHGLQPTRLLRPWDFLGKSTGVGCHGLLRGAPLPINKNGVIVRVTQSKVQILSHQLGYLWCESRFTFLKMRLVIPASSHNSWLL